MKIINISVNNDTGEILMEAKGYPDKTCINDLKEIEDMFGPPKEEKLKPEAYKVPTSNRVKGRS